ncbi:MAG: RluA family pseudouridine synthase [Alphaproteobacteria bacterium]|nr:RluA family pseudouridine synthase [Alphaproteobacteria bacterium]
MSEATQVSVAEDEAGQRLDRWFKRRFPDMTHGRLEKLLRTGQIRVDGGRAKAGLRLETGQTIRVPPLSPPAEPAAPRPVPEHEAQALRRMVLYRDDAMIVLAKPPGLAVQGGTHTTRHLDGMLDALRFDSAERPRLVHRLDKDTSGALLLARTAAAAAALTAAFRRHDIRKAYWALVVGVPDVAQGRISAPLSKLPGRHGERMVVDEEDGRDAVTDYRVVETVGERMAWLELEPRTGRTHQLRAHCALLGTPIAGDGKYGGATAFIPGDAIETRLHLHARAILVPNPRGKAVVVTAPLPPHMAEAFRFFGLNERDAGDPFTHGE